jgi:broad specificity phosphatase PhoE
MSENLQELYVVRHGETEWSLSGQHTGLTNLPLTERGEEEARTLYERLAGIQIDRAFTSPLQRAKRTCELAGFGAIADDDHDLVEWNYGKYEGLRSSEIHPLHPGWHIFRDGCPGGESVSQVVARADSFLGRVRAIKGNVLVFSSGHFSRMLAVRWLGLDAIVGSYFSLNTASVNVLGYENFPSQPVIRLWNDVCHLKAKPTPI